MNKMFIKDRWTEDDYKELLNYLKSIADENYKKFNSNLIPNVDNLMGIRVPMLRDLSKSIAKGNWQEYLKVCKDDYFEETMLQGFVLNNLKIEVNMLMEYMDKFIIKIDNWATCDTFCSGMKIIKNNKEEFYPYIKKLVNSDKPFSIRTGLVMLLAHYIDDNYIDNIFDISNKVKMENYYVKMANAWLIATCYSKYEDKTKMFLYNNNLDDWTFNKAIQKILESKTTKPEEKIVLRQLKK